MYNLSTPEEMMLAPGAHSHLGMLFPPDPNNEKKRWSEIDRNAEIVLPR